MVEVHRLCNIGDKAMISMVNVALMNWANCILKQCEEALSQFTKNLSVR